MTLRWAAIVLAAVPGSAPFTRASEKPMAPVGNPAAPEKLTAKEEGAIRAAVYKGEMLTAMPQTGEWAGFQILVVPKEVGAFRATKRRAAVALLLDIVKGGRP